MLMNYGDLLLYSLASPSHMAPLLCRLPKMSTLNELEMDIKTVPLSDRARIQNGQQPSAVLVKDERDPTYGWVCTACVFFIFGHTWGLIGSYGVFLAYYIANDTYPGATRLNYAFVGGLSMSQAMLVSPLATSSIRYLGTRNTLLIGVFLETISLIAASFTKSLWQLILSQGICFGWGTGFLFTASGQCLAIDEIIIKLNVSSWHYTSMVQPSA
jgi:hypothetical protein